MFNTSHLPGVQYSRYVAFLECPQKILKLIDPTPEPTSPISWGDPPESPLKGDFLQISSCSSIILGKTIGSLTGKAKFLEAKRLKSFWGKENNFATFL